MAADEHTMAADAYVAAVDRVSDANDIRTSRDSREADHDSELKRLRNTLE